MGCNLKSSFFQRNYIIRKAQSQNDIAMGANSVSVFNGKMAFR